MIFVRRFEVSGSKLNNQVVHLVCVLVLDAWHLSGILSKILLPIRSRSKPIQGSSSGKLENQIIFSGFAFLGVWKYATMS